MTADTGSLPNATPARQDWLAVLAHAPREALHAQAQRISSQTFETLRAPEIGLVMLRGRIGNSGDRFNLGEATVTRCVLRHRGLQGRVTAGVGYVLGRDEERATWVAQFDALLQQDEHQSDLLREVIAPLREVTAQARTLDAARTAASRVQFFTVAPETAA